MTIRPPGSGDWFYDYLAARGSLPRRDTDQPIEYVHPGWRRAFTDEDDKDRCDTDD